MGGSTARKSSPAVAGPWPEVALAASQAATARLVEALLHGTRNLLNAMTMNLGALGEKLKDDSGAVPPTLEKNLRIVRDQVFRVDAILRVFAEFMATRPSQLSELSLAQVLERARQTLEHEARDRRVAVKMDLEPGLQVQLSDPLALRFLAFQALLRALLRSPPGGEVEVGLRRQGDRAVLEVRDAGGDEEPDASPGPALEALGRVRSVEVSIQAGRCELTFPAR